MAERRRFTVKEYAIGIVVVLVAFLVVFFGAAAINLDVPQWLLSAISAALGVWAWFAIIGRKGKEPS